MFSVRTVLAAAAAASLGFVAVATATGQSDDADGEPATTDLSVYEFVKIDTNKGDIVVLLDKVNAPISVRNFVEYANADHYDGTIFHRVISNFMIQGGGYNTDLDQKPVRSPIPNEWTNGLKNDPYTLAMARLGRQPDSATSQFFINVSDNSFLDQPRDGAGYAVFGTVIAGRDVVDSIKNVEVGFEPKVGIRPGTQPAYPVEQIVIEDVATLSLDELSGTALQAANEWDTLSKRVAEERAEREAKERDRIKNLVESAREVIVSQGANPEDAVFVDLGGGLGYWYVETAAGDGEKPKSKASRVTVHYTGWLTDGSKFDSSRDRGQPATFPLSGVVRGWTEGVSDMPLGSRRILILPHELAYGEAGRPPVIPPAATLVFDVELLASDGG